MGRVFITGASRGLGFACARCFLQRHPNLHLFLVSRDAERIQRSVQDLRSQFPQAKLDALACDLRNNQTSYIMKSLERVWQGLGPDVVVHAAGTHQARLLVQSSEDDLRSQVELNLSSVLSLNRHLIKRMVMRRPTVSSEAHAPFAGKSIILLSSVIARRAMKGSSVYSSTKAAIEGLTPALAVEYGHLGLRVNAVAPGLIQTEMTQHLQPTEEEIARRIPLGRCGVTEEVAQVVYFLTQASYVTGQVITVDGGLSVSM